MEGLSCSGRLIRPFLRVLAAEHGPSQRTRQAFAALADGPRVPVQRAHETLEHWVRASADPALGLKAGAAMYLGEAGVLDYAIHSAVTVREALRVARRHGHLVSDSLEPVLEVDGNSAYIRLETSMRWPKVAADFTLSAWYSLHVRALLVDAPAIECWFAYPEPADPREHRRVFAGARLRFGMPWYGFAFEARLADVELVGGDRALHAMHCKHLDVACSALQDERDFASRVRTLVGHELQRGRPTVGKVARRMQVSSRTVVRKLSREGTTFSAELDRLRHQRALGLLASDQVPVSAIAELLGFTSASVFHRAFRRWTGQTPIQYREQHAAR
jgi:AraC-like DNA-binding protein